MASTPKWEWRHEPLSTGSKAQGARPTAGSPVPAPLAQALVSVDVGFAAGACVRHILEVVDEAGDQAAAQITPESEMGRPEEGAKGTGPTPAGWWAHATPTPGAPAPPTP